MPKQPPKGRVSVEDSARELGHAIIEAIRDFKDGGREILWLDDIILKHLKAERTRHAEEKERLVDTAWEYMVEATRKEIWSKKELKEVIAAKFNIDVK